MAIPATACEDPPPPPPRPAATTLEGSTAASATASVTAVASVAPKPPRILTPPASSAIAKLDVDGACLAICQAQVRCSVSESVAADAGALAKRMANCARSCRKSRPPKEVEARYLDQAKRCLNATDCDMFSGCAFGSAFTH
jgi:hypothetical protein